MPEAQTDQPARKPRKADRPKPPNGAYGVAIYKKQYAPKAPRDWFRGNPKITDDDAMEACGLIACGASLAEAAEHINVSPAGLWEALVTRHDQMYRRASELLADQHSTAILAVMRDVAAGKMSEGQGRIVMDGAKWLAERLDRRRFGANVQPPAPVLIPTLPSTEYLQAALELAKQAGLTHQLLQMLGPAQAPAIEGESRAITPPEHKT